MTKINLKSLGLALSLATGFAAVGVGAVAPVSAQSVGAGAQIAATFDTAMNTKNAAVGQQFRMTVQSPSSLAGSIIHGHVADVRSGGQGRKAYFRLVTDYLSLGNGQTATLNAHFTETGAKPENTTVQKAAGAGGGLLVGSQTLGRLGGAIGAIGDIAGAAGGYAYANNKKPNLFIDRGFAATIVTDQAVYVKRSQTHY